MSEINPSIFKAYDVRGLYGDEMDGDTAYLIGRAFARVLADLRGKATADLRVGLGRDMRLTAPEMSGRVRDGLVDEGCTVLDAGLVGTEMLYYLVGSEDLDGGAMVTASHNPKAYTGIKLVREGALALSGDTGIEAIRDLVLAGLGETAAKPGEYVPVDVYDGFQAKALSFIDPAKLDGSGLKVVVDGGNGMAGPMVGPLLERLDIELVPTYWRPDGEFPDHEPNPLLPENREAIIGKVLDENADVGIAWDGDADRCFFIDGKGRFVDGDFLTAMLAREILRSAPGSKILYDVRASRAVADTVAEAGGTSNVNRVGHAFFKRSLREQDAVFGGEVSGHYYFRDFWCADSGTIPALLVLQMLATGGRSLADMLDDFRSRYFISGEINSVVDDPDAKMEEIVERFSDGEITRLDGISIDFPDWHFNVRKSNTEPLLRLNLESLVSEEDMAAKRDEILGLIRG